MCRRNGLEVYQEQRKDSRYDWFNIELHQERVGKMRAKVHPRQLTIYSIEIDPAYRGCGLATEVIERMKHAFETLKADRVRLEAKGFWKKMGFRRKDRNSFIYDNMQGRGR
jgi:ribosomal protein S18 acetylase RimI-like enzyme